MDHHISTYSVLGRAYGRNAFKVCILRSLPGADKIESEVVAEFILTKRSGTAAYFKTLSTTYRASEVGPTTFDLLLNVDGLLEKISTDRIAASVDLLNRTRDWISTKVAPFYHDPSIHEEDGALVLRASRPDQKAMSARAIAKVKAATPGRVSAQPRRRARASSAVWI
jgi:hypothetical protein